MGGRRGVFVEAPRLTDCVCLVYVGGEAAEGGGQASSSDLAAALGGTQKATKEASVKRQVRVGGPLAIVTRDTASASTPVQAPLVT